MLTKTASAISSVTTRPPRRARPPLATSDLGNRDGAARMKHPPGQTIAAARPVAAAAPSLLTSFLVRQPQTSPDWTSPACPGSHRSHERSGGGADRERRFAEESEPPCCFSTVGRRPETTYGRPMTTVWPTAFAPRTAPPQSREHAHPPPRRGRRRRSCASATNCSFGTMLQRAAPMARMPRHGAADEAALLRRRSGAGAALARHGSKYTNRLRSFSRLELRGLLQQLDDLRNPADGGEAVQGGQGCRRRTAGSPPPPPPFPQVASSVRRPRRATRGATRWQRRRDLKMVSARAWCRGVVRAQRLGGKTGRRSLGCRRTARCTANEGRSSADQAILGAAPEVAPWPSPEDREEAFPRASASGR
jgi:hypothetical protein